MAWHFHGTPPYLSAQGRRLGMTEVIVARAKNNAEIHRISIMLGQLCERWHKARKEDGVPVHDRPTLEHVEASFVQAEHECAKLHALAGAAAEMIDEGRKAWGLSTPRHYAVMSDNDAPTVRTNGTPTAVRTKTHV